MDCATSALFITERRDDHHPKDAATVTAAVFQKSGGYPYKVDHESVHRSDSSPRQQHYPKPAQRAGLTGFLTILSSSCRPRLDVHTAGVFWLSGQVISAQGISGRTGGMNRRGWSSQAPEDMSEPSVDIIAQRCQLCTHHGVKGGGSWPGFWAAPQARSRGPWKGRCPDAKDLCHTIGDGLEATILRSSVPALSARRIADTPAGDACFHAKTTSQDHRPTRPPPSGK